ncbi:MAG: branched-chain amino acid ABC transporter permease [Chloroflexota bacterium]
MIRPATLVGLVALILVAIPLVADNYWIGLLTQALIFGGFAVGLDLLVGYTGMATLGHAAFFGIAGYGVALGITRWGLNPWIAAGVGIVVSVAIAVGLGPLAVRLRGLAFLTVTLAFGQVAWGFATRGGSFTGGENGIPGVTRPSLGLGAWDLQSPVSFYIFTLLCVAVITFAITRFAASSVGLSFLGIRDSDTRMLALGYDVQSRRALAFIVAGSVGAVYGVLNAFFNGFVGPGSIDWRLSAQMLLSVVIGGAGSLWGPFLGGAGLHVLKTYLTGQTEAWPMVLGALYVLTVMILPGGLASLPTVLRTSLSRFGRKEATPQPSAGVDSGVVGRQ